jgi:tetratricopeptide (TPR) repeat protein
MSSPSDDRARALAVAQDFGAEALDLNRRLVAANPADAGSRTRLARCYLQAGRLDEAEAEYREVLRLNPRNLIATGGLETLERQRHQGEVAAEEARAARPTRARRDGAARPRASSLSTSAEPVPQTFTGFGRGDFAELAGCRRRLVSARFAPRVVDLVRRVNALASSAEIAGIREPGKRQLFRASRSDVHAGDAHWSVFNLGGRWEPQCNIGMYGGQPVGNWVRIGIGFDLADEGADPDRAAGVTKVRQHFRRFQEILTSPRRSLFLGWMVKENARLQCNEGGPRLDVREPPRAASLIAELDPERTEWMFFGKWLRLEDADEAAILVDPVTLVRTIDRVFTGLVPLWRALHEPSGSP